MIGLHAVHLPFIRETVFRFLVLIQLKIAVLVLMGPYGVIFPHRKKMHFSLPRSKQRQEEDTKYVMQIHNPAGML